MVITHHFNVSTAANSDMGRNKFSFTVTKQLGLMFQLSSSVQLDFNNFKNYSEIECVPHWSDFYS